MKEILPTISGSTKVLLLMLIEAMLQNDTESIEGIKAQFESMKVNQQQIK